MNEVPVQEQHRRSRGKLLAAAIGAGILGLAIGAFVGRATAQEAMLPDRCLDTMTTMAEAGLRYAEQVERVRQAYVDYADGDPAELAEHLGPVVQGWDEAQAVDLVDQSKELAYACAVDGGLNPQSRP